MSGSFRSKKSVMEVLQGLSTDPHHPMSAMIEVADRCNEVCVHCYQIQGQKGELETHEWKKILDQLAELGVIVLTISGGEATLRHDFLELVTYAREKRFAVKLYTNGLNMTAELARRLGELAVQEAQISLYSHRAEVHDWVTRVPGSWAKTVAGARHLVDAGVGVVLKTPVMSVNVDEIDEYTSFVASLGADYQLDPQLDPREDGDTTPQRLRLKHEDQLRVLRHPKLMRARPRNKPSRPLDAPVCAACSGGIHIEADGDMRPCTQLPVSVGHALRDGVADSWRDAPAARGIRDLTWRDLHGCRECDLRSYCGRCFANARQEVGDALAPYESACEKARIRYEHVTGREARAADATGPYREIEEGVFASASHELTEADHALRDRQPWILSDQPTGRPADRVGPGQLVQIRRPGARKTRSEVIPAPLDGIHVDCSDVSRQNGACLE